MNALADWRWSRLIAAGMLLSAAAGCGSEDDRSGLGADPPPAAAVTVGAEDLAVPAIAAADLIAALDSEDQPIVLDVRTAEEYEAGHVPGAINIPHDHLPERLHSLEELRGRDFVVYCRTGRRAEYAERVLRDAGFERVWDLDGHMVRWNANELPMAGTCS